MLTRPDHVTLEVTDLPAARVFFETLGFEVTIEAVISGPVMEAYMGVPGIRVAASSGDHALSCGFVVV